MFHICGRDGDRNRGSLDTLIKLARLVLLLECLVVFQHLDLAEVFAVKRVTFLGPASDATMDQVDVLVTVAVEERSKIRGTMLAAAENPNLGVWIRPGADSLIAMCLPPAKGLAVIFG